MEKRTIFGLAMAGATILSSCGSSPETIDKVEPATVDSDVLAGGIEVTYFEDGSRTLVVPAQFDNSGMSEVRVLQWCTGLDLVTNSQQSYNSGSTGEGGAGSTNVNPNYPPCEDGRLTPSDFIVEK